MSRPTASSLHVDDYHELLHHVFVETDDKRQTFIEGHEAATFWFHEQTIHWSVGTDPSEIPLTARAFNPATTAYATRLLSLYNHKYNKTTHRYPDGVWRFNIDFKRYVEGQDFKWDHPAHPGISSWSLGRIDGLELKLLREQLSGTANFYRQKRLFECFLKARPKQVVWDYRSFPVIDEAHNYVEWLLSVAGDEAAQISAGVDPKMTFPESFTKTRPGMPGNHNLADLMGWMRMLRMEISSKLGEKEVILYHPGGLMVEAHDSIEFSNIPDRRKKK